MPRATMKVENLAHQRPASAFAGGGWYLDTPLFQGLVAHAVFVVKPAGQTALRGRRYREGERHRVVMFFKERG